MLSLKLVRSPISRVSCSKYLARYWFVFQGSLGPSRFNAAKLYKIARLSGLNNPMTTNGL